MQNHNQAANIKVKKTAIYTNVNGDITHRKQQKSKPVILLNSTLTFGDVLLGNITFFDMCCFQRVTHCVTVNIKLQIFLHLCNTAAIP